jgi:hypothetical protein
MQELFSDWPVIRVVWHEVSVAEQLEEKLKQQAEQLYFRFFVLIFKNNRLTASEFSGRMERIKRRPGLLTFPTKTAGASVVRKPLLSLPNS